MAQGAAAGAQLLWRRPRARSAAPGEEQRRPLSCHSPGCLSSGLRWSGCVCSVRRFCSWGQGGQGPRPRTAFLTGVLEQEGGTQQGVGGAWSLGLLWSAEPGCTGCLCCGAALGLDERKGNLGPAEGGPFRKGDKIVKRRGVSDLFLGAFLPASKRLPSRLQAKFVSRKASLKQQVPGPSGKSTQRWWGHPKVPPPPAFPSPLPGIREPFSQHPFCFTSGTARDF